MSSEVMFIRPWVAYFGSKNRIRNRFSGSFPFAGKTWIPQQWGGECLMALAYRAGGFDTMLLGFAVLVAGMSRGRPGFLCRCIARLPIPA